MLRRAKQVCACTGCSAHPGSCSVVVGKGLCQPCSGVADRARGSRQQRGYDAEHDALRRRWKPKVERGGVHCHAERCLMPARLILTGQDWDLGHTDDRKQWTGPEHAFCNRSAGGRAAHGG
jgi:hypothetical protein